MPALFYLLTNCECVLNQGSLENIDMLLSAQVEMFSKEEHDEVDFDKYLPQLLQVSFTYVAFYRQILNSFAERDESDATNALLIKRLNQLVTEESYLVKAAVQYGGNLNLANGVVVRKLPIASSSSSMGPPPKPAARFGTSAKKEPATLIEQMRVEFVSYSTNIIKLLSPRKQKEATLVSKAEIALLDDSLQVVKRSSKSVLSDADRASVSETVGHVADLLLSDNSEFELGAEAFDLSCNCLFEWFKWCQLMAKNNNTAMYGTFLGAASKNAIDKQDLTTCSHDTVKRLVNLSKSSFASIQCIGSAIQTHIALLGSDAKIGELAQSFHQNMITYISHEATLTVH